MRYYLWDDWHTEAFSSLPRNTQLISSRAGIRHQGSGTRPWSPKCYTKKEAANTSPWESAASDQVGCGGERGAWAEESILRKQGQRKEQTWRRQNSAFHELLKIKTWVRNPTQWHGQTETFARTSYIMYSYQHFTKGRTKNAKESCWQPRCAF